MKKLLFILLILPVLFTGCHNQGFEFPDYDYSIVYFPYQYPVRTLVMGEDTYDTSLDNQHKCAIYATVAGLYANKGRIAIDIVVDNTLCDNLYYEGGTPVQAMPSNYYSLAANEIVLDKNLQGGVEVQFTDAFFADEKALENTYVIPVRMTGVANADSILCGQSAEPNPVRTNGADWNVTPKDYILYCVKYINTWHAAYLRRGVDVINENGVTTTNVRRAQYVEKDEECNVYTKTLNSAVFPVTVSGRTCDLLLTFNDNNECTITSATTGYTASGSGKFVEKGEKKSWGNEDRNALYLEYEVDFSGIKSTTKDTLVVQTRGVSLETFTPYYEVK